MMWPPSLVFIRTGRIKLWLPLFLLWPLVAVLALVLEPMALLAGMLVLPLGWKRARSVMVFIPNMIRLFVLLRGFEVDVVDGKGTGFGLRLI